MRWTFSGFVLDADARELSRGGVAVRLTPKALCLLDALAAAAPVAVSRADLYRLLWGDTCVEEANLPTLVHELRTALGDDAHHPRFIRTVHRFGYHFIAGLKREGQEEGIDSRFVVVVEDGGREVVLVEGANIVGRDAKATIRFNVADVSRRHAVFMVHGRDVSVEDLGSKNGTFVQGKRTSGAVQVVADAEVRVGSIVLLLRERTRDTTVTNVHRDSVVSGVRRRPRKT